jgi:hypothetical protein
MKKSRPSGNSSTIPLVAAARGCADNKKCAAAAQQRAPVVHINRHMLDRRNRSHFAVSYLCAVIARASLRRNGVRHEPASADDRDAVTDSNRS